MLVDIPLYQIARSSGSATASNNGRVVVYAFPIAKRIAEHLTKFVNSEITHEDAPIMTYRILLAWNGYANHAHLKDS